jgi:hypothetical protein
MSNLRSPKEHLDGIPKRSSLPVCMIRDHDTQFRQASTRRERQRRLQRPNCDAAHSNRLRARLYSMHVTAWLMRPRWRDYPLLSGVMEAWYVVISAIPGAITSAERVAGAECGDRLRAPVGWLYRQQLQRLDNRWRRLDHGWRWGRHAWRRDAHGSAVSPAARAGLVPGRWRWRRADLGQRQRSQRASDHAHGGAGW